MKKSALLLLVILFTTTPSLISQAQTAVINLDDEFYVIPNTGGTVSAGGTVNGKVWRETSADKLMAGELGIPGAEIVLTDGPAGCPSNLTGSIAETVTDANGNYRFEGLDSNRSYQIRIRTYGWGDRFIYSSGLNAPGNDSDMRSGSDGVGQGALGITWCTDGPGSLNVGMYIQ